MLVLLKSPQKIIGLILPKKNKQIIKNRNHSSKFKTWRVNKQIKQMIDQLKVSTVVGRLKVSQEHLITKLRFYLRRKSDTR